MKRTSNLLRAKAAKAGINAHEFDLDLCRSYGNFLALSVLNGQDGDVDEIHSAATWYISKCPKSGQ